MPFTPLSFPSARSVRLLLVSGLLGLVLPLHAEKPEAASGLPDASFPYLRELLDNALAQSPQMLQRGIALSRADAEREGGRARYYPTVYSNARTGWDKSSSNSLGGTDSFGTFYSVGVNQALFHWGQISAENEIGKLGQLIARKAYAEAYRNVAGHVRAEFLRLVHLKRGLELRRLTVEASTQGLEDARRRRTVGTASISELGGAEIALAEAQLALDRDVFEYDQARISLARLCGLASIPEERVPTEMPAPVVGERQALKLVEFFDQTDGARTLPSVQIQEHLRRQSELRVSVAKVRLLPKFDLTASAGLENQSYVFGGSLNQSATHRYSVGMAANWTIFDGFASRSAKRQALADKRDAELRLQQVLLSLDDQKRAAVTRHELAVRRLTLAEGAYSRQSAALDEVRERNRTGLVPITVVESHRAACIALERDCYVARAEVYGRWNELISLLWMDPALDKLPQHYLTHGK